MISPHWEPLKYNNESRIWVEWDITIQYLLIVDLQNKLLHQAVDEPISSPHCASLWVLHLLCQPLPQNHTCFPVSQTHLANYICVANIKCRFLIVARYVDSLSVSLYTDGFPTATMLCLSWLTYHPWLALQDRPASSSPPPTSAAVLSLNVLPGFYLPPVAWRLTSYRDNGKCFIRLLKSSSAAFRRLNVGQIHVASICIIVRKKLGIEKRDRREVNGRGLGEKKWDERRGLGPPNQEHGKGAAAYWRELMMGRLVHLCQSLTWFAV